MSDVRPPSRPPPSRSGPAEESTGASAPAPPSRPPPSHVPPSQVPPSQVPPSQVPPSQVPPSRPPTAEVPPTQPPRPRRRWLVPAIAGALVIVLAVGAGAFLLGGGDDVSDDDRAFFARQYEAARANVAGRQGAGVCAVADDIRTQILGIDGELPMVFETYRSEPWDVGSVITHVAFVESLVRLLITEHGTNVPQLSELERRWSYEVRYPLDAKGWRLDDDDVDEILALLDTTLATIESAPFAACDEAPTAGNATSGSKGPRPAPSAITIDRAKRHTATIDTTEGRIVIALDAVNAPASVNNFVYLARAGFYDGLLINRAVRDRSIQTGGPNNTTTGDAGYRIPVELPPGPYVVGSVAWAKRSTDPDGTAGSQFFVITGSAFTSLPRNYGHLGTVTSGLDVAQRIANYAPTSGDGKPTRDVTITKVTIAVT